MVKRRNHKVRKVEKVEKESQFDLVYERCDKFYKKFGIENFYTGDDYESWLKNKVLAELDTTTIVNRDMLNKYCYVNFADHNILCPLLQSMEAYYKKESLYIFFDVYHRITGLQAVIRTKNYSPVNAEAMFMFLWNITADILNYIRETYSKELKSEVGTMHEFINNIYLKLYGMLEAMKELR